MPYTPHTWVDDETITDALLNNMEQGIANATIDNPANVTRDTAGRITALGGVAITRTNGRITGYGTTAITYDSTGRLSGAS